MISKINGCRKFNEEDDDWESTNVQEVCDLEESLRAKLSKSLVYIHAAQSAALETSSITRSMLMEICLVYVELCEKANGVSDTL